MTQADPPEAIRQLALRLAINHLNLSVPNPADREKWATAALKDPPQGRIERARTIVVLGAGASADAFGEDLYPLADSAIERIQSPELLDVRSNKPLNEIVEGRLERVAVQRGGGLSSHDFEAHLSALAYTFGEEKVREVLGQLFDQEWRVHLTFEILAHLLKHRFVDAIINYNFDELLDVAVEQEMGGSEYYRVYSDGDCPTDPMTDGRLKKPVHVKPHGTISHPSSLRFTKDHYFGMPSQMNDFLKKLFQDRSRITLIGIGFGMKALDLRRILDQQLRDNVSIEYFRIDPDPDFDDIGLAPDATSHISVDTAGGGLGAVMHDIWKAVSALFVDRLRPRGIRRHQVVHDLFHHRPQPGEGGTRLPRSESDYVWARFLAELSIEIVKGNGRVALETLSRGRVGAYATRLSTIPGSEEGPLEQAKKALGHVIGFEDERFLGRDLRAHFGDRDEPTKAEDVHEQIAKKGWAALKRALSGILDDDFLAHLGNVDDARMTAHFLRFAASDTRTLEPHFAGGDLLMAKRPGADKVLHTNLAVALKFLEVIGSSAWDLMLVASTAGKTLCQYRDHADFFNRTGGDVGLPPMRERQFAVVTSQTPNEQVVEQRMGQFRECLLGPHVGLEPGESREATQPYYLRPYWASHRSFIVLMARNDVDYGYRPVNAIEFMGARSRVNPVFTEDDGDLRRLVRTFFGYVIEAETYMGLKAGAHAHHVPTVTAKQADQRASTLLREWSRLSVPDGGSDNQDFGAGPAVDNGPNT